MNVICGTDFSTHARAASEVAAALAARLGHRLLLVHAIEDEDCAGLDTATLAEFKQRRSEHLSHAAGLLTPTGALVREEVEMGRADEVLARISSQSDARVVVLSSNGEHGGDPLRVGTVTECTAARANAPVLIVRDPAPLLSWIRGERPLKVFMAVDFTASSDAALAWTTTLRAIGPCAITIGHVSRIEEPNATSEALRERLQRHVCRAIGEGDWVLAVQTSESPPALLLAAMANQAGCDLLVSGAHHSSVWRELLRGSVSQDLLRLATMNVARVPVPRSHELVPPVCAPERILAATDFSDQGNRAVAHACALAPPGSTVKVIYVASNGSDREVGALRRLRAAIPADAEKRGVRTITEILHGSDAADAIRDQADQFDADLICVGTKDRSALSRATIGSVARTLVSRSSRPLLIIHPPKP